MSISNTLYIFQLNETEKLVYVKETLITDFYLRRYFKTTNFSSLFRCPQIIYGCIYWRSVGCFFNLFQTFCDTLFYINLNKLLIRLCLSADPVSLQPDHLITWGCSRYYQTVHQRVLQGWWLQPEACANHWMWQRFWEPVGPTAGFQRFSRYSSLSVRERCCRFGSIDLQQTEDCPAGCHKQWEHQEGSGVYKRGGWRERWAGMTTWGSHLHAHPSFTTTMYYMVWTSSNAVTMVVWN